MAAAAAASDEGYTLVLTPINSLTVNQSLYKDLPFARRVYWLLCWMSAK
jgi:hypothetical protein